MTLTPARMCARGLDTLFQIGTLCGRTDGQLLERFAARRDEGSDLAFAALVERHGPMVLRVCTGILRDDHEAMDAFQATFLVLARKGRSLWVRDSLGPWLHRVACRAAEKARVREGRRRAMERRAAEVPESKVGAADRDDHTTALHEELDRLPDRYRVPIVLCDLEGRTCEEVARHLGRSVRTVKNWRARGRERLRDRLTRRGLVPSAGAFAIVPTAEAAAAAVPAALVGTTVRAAALAAAGRTTAGAVAVLSNGVLRAMFMAKLKCFSAAFLMIIAGAGGTAALSLQPGSGPSGGPTPVRAERSPAGPGSPGITEAKDRVDPLSRDTPKEVEGRILLAELQLKRDEDDLRAMASEIKHESRNEFRAALIDYQRARRALLQMDESHRQKKLTGPFSEAESEVMEAEKAVAIADLHLRWAKIRLMAARFK